MKTIYIILEEDLIFYPPVISVINICLDLGCKIVYLGSYSDDLSKRKFEHRGVVFNDIYSRNINDNFLLKCLRRNAFRNKVYNFLKKAAVSSEDYVWVFHSYTFYLLNKLVDKYNVIYHPLEFSSYELTWKTFLLSPNLNIYKTVNKSNKIVCCEYNRAQLMKGVFSLPKLPYVLPNKMYISEEPSFGNEELEKYLNLLKGKKVILYQGLFHGKERRLEEYCEAIMGMPKEYVLVAMGKGSNHSNYYERLKERYESDKILFIPFVKPPYHLLITKQATIGILSYSPISNKICNVVNVLYCAPNKLFEYSRYGIPMISNDIPGLSYIFNKYKCGTVVSDPITSQSIRVSIDKICENYDIYSKGSLEYYDSVNVKDIVNKIIFD